jgi:hypothetical protein
MREEEMTRTLKMTCIERARPRTSLNTRRAFDAENRYSYILKRAFRFLSTKLNERREENLMSNLTRQTRGGSNSGGRAGRPKLYCMSRSTMANARLALRYTPRATCEPQSLQPAKRSHNKTRQPHHQKDKKPDAKTKQNKTTLKMSIRLEGVHAQTSILPRSAQPRANSRPSVRAPTTSRARRQATTSAAAGAPRRGCK